MPRSKQNLELRLENAGVSPARFEQEKQQLKAFGFTDEQVELLVVRKSSAKTIKLLLANIEWIKNVFAIEQIVKIAGKSGGSKNIEAVKTSHAELQSLGFTLEQIVKIASNGGGSKNVEAVKASHAELKSLGFTLEQIVKIAGNDGGSKNIEAVKASHAELKSLGFTLEQVVRIASANGGSRNIESVKASYSELKSLGFDAGQIVKIASNIGGSKNIEAVKTSYAELKSLGFSAEQIVRIASNEGGSKNIEAVKASHAELKSLGFTAEKVVRIASANGGSRNIEAVKNSHAELKSLGFSAEQIVRIASKGGGSKNIKIIVDSYEMIVKAKCSSKQILFILNNNKRKALIHKLDEVIEKQAKTEFSEEIDCLYALVKSFSNIEDASDEVLTEDALDFGMFPFVGDVGFDYISGLALSASSSSGVTPLLPNAGETSQELLTPKDVLDTCSFICDIGSETQADSSNHPGVFFSYQQSAGNITIAHESRSARRDGDLGQPYKYQKFNSC